MIKNALLGLACVATLASCDTDLLDIVRTINGVPYTVDIPATDQSGTIAETVAYDFDLQGELDTYGISEGLVKKADVASVTVEIVDPSGELTFDDITAATTFFVLGADRITVATLPDDASGTTVSFEVADADLLDYLLTTTQPVGGLEATTTEGVGEGVQAKVTVDIEVTASPAS